MAQITPTVGRSPFRFERLQTSVKTRRTIVVGAIGLLLAFITVYPLAMLFYGSVYTAPPGGAGTFDLSGYRQVFTADTAAVVWNTIAISGIKTVLSLVLAVFFAWVVARTNTPFRRTIEQLLILPFFVPPILTAMAWGMLGNPQVGLINLAWRGMTGLEAPLINVYSYGGMIWHMMQYTTPFLFLLIVDSFRSMDSSLEEASRMSGASSVSTFFRVTLFLLLPVLLSAFLLSFIKGLENFESPLFFGLPAQIEVITTKIYSAINHRSQPDYQFASAISFVVMALMFVAIAAQWKLLNGRNFATVTGKAFRPKIVDIGPWRWLTFTVCMGFFFFSFLLPVGQLVLGSAFQFFGFYQWDLLTLDHYRSVYRNQEMWRAFGNTMLLGFLGASATMVLGSLVAYISVRTTWFGRHALSFLAWLPWLMPGMVLGVGFLWAFAFLPHAIPIYGTIWALLIAYISLGIPIAVRIMSGAFRQLSSDLEECSRVHGANWWRTMRLILIALCWPSFAVGWILIFFGIMRELSASILLYSVGSEVFSVVLLRMWENGETGAASVVGLLMVVLVLIFRIIHLLLARRIRAEM